MTGEFAVAVHALVYLNHKGTTVSSEDLAENICTNPARVRKVMSKLKKAGILSAKEGNIGGYLFDRNPAKVNLNMVLLALDIPAMAPVWRPGSAEKKCLVASGMGDILDGIYAQLDDACRQKLLAITIADIEKQIFGSLHAYKKPLA